MTQTSAPAAEAARRLWARNGGSAATPEELAAVAERVFEQLQTGMARWVGAEGFHALRRRALVLAQPAQPVIAALSGDRADGPAVAAVAEAHGAPEAAESIISVVATLIDLLGRIIGVEMAVRLVEQSGAPSSGNGAASASQGGRNGQEA